MSDSDRELDDCDFTDEVFENQIRQVRVQNEESVVKTRENGNTTLICGLSMNKAYKSTGCGTNASNADAVTQTKKVSGGT